MEDKIFMHYSIEQLLLQKAKNKIISSSKYNLFFDGATKMNPGISGVGYVVVD